MVRKLDGNSFPGSDTREAWRVFYLQRVPAMKIPPFSETIWENTDDFLGFSPSNLGIAPPEMTVNDLIFYHRNVPRSLTGGRLLNL